MQYLDFYSTQPKTFAFSVQHALHLIPEIVLMDYQVKIISEIANRETERICSKVISTFQKMTTLLSGDDPDLKNVWDEICVQVQREQSIFWNLYEDTALTLIEKQVETLPAFIRQTLWLQTEGGQEWSIDTEIDFEERQATPFEFRGEVRPTEVPYTTDEIVNHIFGRLLTKAGDWSNPRIRTSLARTVEFD